MEKRLSEQRGSKILGSNLFRDYCAICNEPIRVNANAIFSQSKAKGGLVVDKAKKNYCSDCVDGEVLLRQTKDKQDTTGETDAATLRDYVETREDNQ